MRLKNENRISNRIFIPVCRCAGLRGHADSLWWWGRRIDHQRSERAHGATGTFSTGFTRRSAPIHSRGRWQKSYAGSNVDEFFAELTIWYFGTHGDLSMTGPKPKKGREGLREYDPEAFALMDDFYSGRIEIGKVEPRRRRTDDSR
jgi:hypothetical protein